MLRHITTSTTVALAAWMVMVTECHVKVFAEIGSADPTMPKTMSCCYSLSHSL